MRDLTQQLAFLQEIDKVKAVFRQTWLLDGSRRENDAEHAWHLAMMAMTLADQSDEPVDVAHVVRMVLIHDLVEIDAGDVFIYDEQARANQHEREVAAAERIFGMLPPPQAGEYRALWDEFEARVTPEARFARALDRLQPLMHNYVTEGKAWRQHGVAAEQVRAINALIGDASQSLWAQAQAWIDDAHRRGWLR